MKITKSNLLNLWQVFESMQNQKKGVKFSYFVAKNKIAIKDEVTALNTARESSDVFKKFEMERGKLAQSMSDKVPGTEEPVIQGNQYIIKEKAEEFAKEIASLREKFQSAISERDEQITTFNKLLTDEVEFEGYKIELDNLPVDIEATIIEVLLNANLIEES